MKRFFTLTCILLSLQIIAQDSTINKVEKKPVKIFDSEKLINANTTETVGNGKMEFKVTHNFGDIAGSGGGIRRFFGLDNAADIKIGFEIGLSDKFDVIFSRVRGAESYVNSYSSIKQVFEFGFKYRPLQQMENDPSHPLSLAIFANTAISAMRVPTFPSQALADSAETNFQNLGERMSQVAQLIIAKKFGKVSLQLNPTFVHRGRAMKGDDQSFFAIGGAARIPLGKSVNFVVDYFHNFRSESSENFYKTARPPIHNGVKFYDPLGVGVEIITAGHIFHLNFTNCTEILENRLIPRTVTSWGNGQYRWGFTISRTFVLWRPKNNSVSW